MLVGVKLDDSIQQTVLLLPSLTGGTSTYIDAQKHACSREICPLVQHSAQQKWAYTGKKLFHSVIERGEWRCERS